MQRERVRIQLTLEVDLDPVPGWGHQKEDWVEYAKNRLTRDLHYNPVVSIEEVFVSKKDEPKAGQ